MIISLIAAMTPERVIGVDNRLPWHLPADLAWFKRHTLQKPILMGRKTYHSIGQPLSQRHNIVLSRKQNIQSEITWVQSIEAAIDAAGNAPELMVIGGGTLYQQLLPRADRLYLSLVDTHLPGTVYFPDYDQTQWLTRFSEYHPADERHLYNCRFIILERSPTNSVLTPNS